MDPTEGGATQRQRPVRPDGPERGQVSRSVNAGYLQQRLDLRREVEGVADEAIEQRADTHAVAAEHQSLAAPVVEREGILAVESGKTLWPPLFIEVHQHFAIRAGAEAMAAGDQALAQLDMIEDLTVGDDPDSLVLVRERLASALHIYDREASVPEMRFRPVIHAGALWATVMQGVKHGQECRRVSRAVEPTCYATHPRDPLWSTARSQLYQEAPRCPASEHAIAYGASRT